MSIMRCNLLNRRGASNKGVALVMTLFALVMTTSFGALISLRGINESVLAQRQLYQTKAFWAADAGVQHAMWEVRTRNCVDIAGCSSCANCGGGELSTTIPGAEFTVNVQSGVTTMVSHGYSPSMADPKAQRNIQFSIATSSIFLYAAFAKEEMTISNNALIDSYNSAKLQADGTECRYGAVCADGTVNTGTNGNIGTNGSTIGIIDIGNNAQIKGNVGTGVGGTVTGDLSGITGSITHTSNVQLTSVTVPSFLTSLADGGVYTIEGVKIIAGGNYRYQSLTAGNNGDLLFWGNTWMYLTSTAAFVASNNFNLSIGKVFTCPTANTITVPATAPTTYGLSVNDVIYLNSTGTMPTGLTAGTKYYVKTIPSATTLTVSLTAGGSAVGITAGSGSGTHSMRVVKDRTFTCTSSNTLTTTAAHGLLVNDVITVSSTGTLPTGLAAGTTYYVATVPSTTTLTLTLSPGQSTVSIAAGTGSGTHTLQADNMAKLILYVDGVLDINNNVALNNAGGRPQDFQVYSTYSGLGPEMVANNTFHSDSIWSKTAGWRIDHDDSSYAEKYADGVTTLSEDAVSMISAPVSGTNYQFSYLVVWQDTATYHFTCQTTNTITTSSAHGFSVGDKLTVSSTGILPTGLAANTTYFVKTVPTSTTMTVSTTSGGSVVAITAGTGSGTHTVIPKSFFSTTVGGKAGIVRDKTDPVTLDCTPDYEGACWKYSEQITASNSTGVIFTPSRQSRFILDNVSLREISTAAGVSVKNNANAILTVYAPDTTVDINNNGQVLGAVVGKSVAISNNTAVHYDDTLKDISTPYGAVSVQNWQEI
ncbi:MAG: hypothetical protein HQL21_05235 [Candidatus Omnitrophica bacterium]|nr:hypothetical protein [Candidatus Omnitrophota bacterium]